MIKPYLCALVVLLLPVTILAQQSGLPTPQPEPTELPNAPQPTIEFASADSTSLTQQQPATPQTQQPETDAERHARAAEELKKEEKQRVLGVLPAFNSVIGGKAEPLTPGQKFHLFFRGSIDPYQFALAGIDSGIEQAENSHPDYHQGLKGYARRYGASYADNFIGNFFGNAVFPSLFHQDPRYFRLGHGTILHRALYSASTTIRTKGDNGKWQPAYSNILGNIVGGAISNVYYPASDRGIGQTFSSALTVTYEGTFGALLLEFYPDVVQHYKDKHARKLAQAAQKDSTPVPPAPQH